MGCGGSAENIKTSEKMDNGGMGTDQMDIGDRGAFKVSVWYEMADRF